MSAEQKKKCEEKGKLLNEKTGRCVCHRNKKTGKCIKTEKILDKKKSKKSVTKKSVVTKNSVTLVTKKKSVTKKSVTLVTKKKSVKKKRDRSPDVIFGGDGIASLSGPVSFYYLRPIQTVYEEGNGKYFPLIVLFGDVHRSLEKICKPCSKWSTKKKCYELSDPHFLIKLDTLSTPDHPVDFYTETVLSGTGEGFKGGMMKDLTSGEMISCYHHRLRGTDYDKCPTKNIRWHASETRTIWNYWYDYNDDDFMNELYDDPSNVSKMEEKTWIEQEFSMILNYFSELTTDLPKANKKIYIERINDILRDGFFKNIKKLQTLLSTLAEDVKGDKFNYEINFEKFANAFFRLFTKDNSLIYKQIAKQSYPPFRSFQTWIDFYKRSLSYVRGMFINQLYYLEKKRLRETIGKLSEALSNEDFQFNDTEIRDLKAFVDISIPLLDIYTIARIWKQPMGGIRSSLSFCYFGDDHVTNIVRLLLTTNMYELVYKKPRTELTDVSRCKTFDETLNLSEEVRVHNGKID